MDATDSPFTIVTRYSHRIGRARRRLAERIRRCCAYVSPLGWTLAAGGTACLFAFPLLGWTELIAFGIAAMTMVFAAMILAFGNTRFNARIHVANRRVTVGDTVSVIVDIGNSSKSPTANAQGELPIGTTHEQFSISMLNPGQTKQINVEFQATTRAVLPIGPLHIRKGDPFGLIRRDTDVTKCINVFIHPKIVSLDMLDAGILRDLEGQSSGHIVDDDLDFHGLREYQLGDDVRNVHWLSSAKTGTPTVRQYEATRRTDTAVTLSVNPDDYASAEEFEMAVSIHASIGVQCLLQHRPLDSHAGPLHTQPHSAMSFLDATSAIEPSLADELNLAESTLRHSPHASCYFFTVGSLKNPDQITRMTLTLPRSARCMVVQANIGANRSVKQWANCTLGTIGNLADLPAIMGVIT